MSADESFRYSDREYSRDELRTVVEAEAAELPPKQ